MARVSCLDVKSRLVPNRAIDGICAVLLPFRSDGEPDIAALLVQVERILKVGLTPAINMDTGFVQFLDQRRRRAVLAAVAPGVAGRRFVVGAPAADRAGELTARYRDEVAAIVERGGTPILFPGPELAVLPEEAVVRLHAEVAKDLPSGAHGMLAFELGRAFVPFGRIYSVATVERLMEIPGVIGMKHSSLDRGLEWERLDLRDRLRPDFKIYTGNDLAIDMVCYGSDYLLGLAAFHPEAFAARDQLWARGDARSFAFNDALQALGSFAFRVPVPAYRHNAAQFLKLRGVIEHDGIPVGAPRRPDSDVEVLATFNDRIEDLLREIGTGDRPR